jgi:D-galactarolactone cycloisomerase
MTRFETSLVNSIRMRFSVATGFKIDAEGYLEIPDKPGLGIELDRVALTKYTRDPTPLFEP